MSDNTHIQWTDRTFNVVSGCTKISDGCLKCYIERTPPFRMAHRRFDKPGIGGTTGVVLHEDRLTQPLTWRKPARVFVCSLADLFHDAVPDAFVAKLWAVMALTPQHSYQILTKRPPRMRALLSSSNFHAAVLAFASELNPRGETAGRAPDVVWPLPNVWCGTSVEDQKWADIRIPHLLATPAAVRFISAEPLLGPVVLRDEWLGADTTRGNGPTLDWAIVGGESGSGARYTDPQWIANLVAQCRRGTTAPFVKQLGSPWATANDAADRKGGDWHEWPADLRVREYPAQRAVAA